MLKIELPLAEPSIWLQIKALRCHDVCQLSPVMKERVLALQEDIKNMTHITVGKKDYVFDPILFETERKDALQRIYFKQGSTHAPSAIYGWHFFRVATDWISASMEWTVPQAWWDTLGNYMKKHGIDPGNDWNDPDHPHGQLHGLKKSPSDLTRVAYFDTKHWQSLKPFEGSQHEAALLRVWKIIGAV
jgi:hypothetical protein